MKDGAGALCATAALFVLRTRNNKHYTSHTAYYNSYSYLAWILGYSVLKLTDICDSMTQKI